MTNPSDQHFKGLILTALGGLALTVDIPLIKLAAGESWSILFARSGATLGAALVAWFVWRTLRGNAPALVPGRAGLAVAGLYGIGSISFVMAVFNTSTANLVFILALNTMFAALFGWLFLGERPRRATFLAMAATLVGVLVIVGDGVGSGNLLGDALAMCSALAIACAITITRKTGKEMGFASLVAVVIPLCVAGFMVSGTGIRIEAPWWILLNGAVIMPFAFFCLATGPRYITGPEVAMFYLLETVLAPIWVWMIFSETPTRATLVGGAIIIAALVAHSLWQLSEGRRRKAAALPRHPA